MDDAASGNCVLGKPIKKTHTAFFDKITDLITLSVKNCSSHSSVIPTFHQLALCLAVESRIETEKVQFLVLSSAAKPGTHFLENNKIIGVFTMLKLCVSKERNM